MISTKPLAVPVVTPVVVLPDILRASPVVMEAAAILAAPAVVVAPVLNVRVVATAVLPRAIASALVAPVPMLMVSAAVPVPKLIVFAILEVNKLAVSDVAPPVGKSMVMDSVLSVVVISKYVLVPCLIVKAEAVLSLMAILVACAETSKLPFKVSDAKVAAPALVTCQVDEVPRISTPVPLLLIAKTAPEALA